LTRQLGAALLLALLAASAHPANAVIQTALPQQIFPMPSPAPAPSTPAPLPPPTNPGYASAPSDGLSPILTQPGPVYELPPPPSPSYPPPQLPGPIDQQKTEAYRNSLRAQQWQSQSRGVSPDTPRSREIQQQLTPPDWQ
jgi:hypothetical protein